MGSYNQSSKMGGYLVLSEKQIPMKHLTSLIGCDNGMILDLVKNSIKIKANPDNYSDVLHNKSLLMIFEKPSLRTRVSFQVGMHQLGGHSLVMETKDNS